MLKQIGIYLVQPKGRLLRPLDLDRRRIQKVAKVNEKFIKFGKFEKSLEVRYKDYQKIFGDDVKFEVIVSFTDISQLIEFRDHISSIFEGYKISNPGSSRKLEWMTGITFSKAKKIILHEYNYHFSKETGLEKLIASLQVGEFTRLYGVTLDSLLDWAKQKTKVLGRPKGSKDILGLEVKNYLKYMVRHFQFQNADISKREIANQILAILNTVSEEKIGNTVLIKIRRLSPERLRKLIE